MKKLILLLSLATFTNSLIGQTIDSIEYKRGGGLSGIITSYRYFKKSVLKAEGIVNLDYIFHKKINKGEWKKIQTSAKQLMQDSANYNQIANYYTSIIIYSLDIKKKYTWPAGTKDIPAPLQQLVKQLEQNQ
jgi:hypothetical protein